jgi:hypothetical protein
MDAPARRFLIKSTTHRSRRGEHIGRIGGVASIRRREEWQQRGAARVASRLIADEVPSAWGAVFKSNDPAGCVSSPNGVPPSVELAIQYPRLPPMLKAQTRRMPIMGTPHDPREYQERNSI